MTIPVTWNYITNKKMHFFNQQANTCSPERILKVVIYVDYGAAALNL